LSLTFKPINLIF